MQNHLDWYELKKRLVDIQKDGWSWSVGYSRQRGAVFVAKLWKDKEGIQKLTWTARQGRHVISEYANSPEEALAKALSCHKKGTFDPTPPPGPLRPKAPEKPKEGQEE